MRLECTSSYVSCAVGVRGSDRAPACSQAPGAAGQLQGHLDFPITAPNMLVVHTPTPHMPPSPLASTYACPHPRSQNKKQGALTLALHVHPELGRVEVEDRGGWAAHQEVVRLRQQAVRAGRLHRQQLQHQGVAGGGDVEWLAVS